MSDKWKENAMKYLSERWNEKSFLNMYQKSALKETLEIFKQSVLKNGVDIVFDGKKLHFDCLTEKELDVKVKFVNLGNASNRGMIDYDRNIIYLNKNMKYGADTYVDFSHEYSHKIQSELINHIDEYAKDSTEYKYLSLARAQIKQDTKDIVAFGISFSGNLYFNPRTNAPQRLQSLTMPLYNLQTIERNAQEVEQGAMNYLKKCAAKELQITIKEHLQSSVKEINRIYNSNWTDEQLYQIIDNASLCIQRGVSPSEYADFTATLMYDMTCHLYATHENWNEIGGITSECNDILDLKNKAIALRDAYQCPFAVYGSNTRHDKNVMLNEYCEKPSFTLQISDINSIRQMTERERISNPEFLIACLMANENHNAILQRIGDTEFIKDWLMDNLSSTSEYTLECMQNILDFDVAELYYERENRRVEIRNPENIDLSHSILKENFDFGFPKYQFDDGIEEEIER